MELRGKTIFLRPLTVHDATPRYLSWMCDSEVSQYLESRFQKHTIESLKSFISSLKPEKDILFGMFDSANGEHIGNIKLGNINAYHGFADIGLLIGEKTYWGKGIGTEAIRLVCEHAFNTLGLKKVIAGMYENNTGSYKAFIKNGFREVGRLQKHFRFGDAWIDSILVEISASAFASRVM